MEFRLLVAAVLAVAALVVVLRLEGRLVPRGRGVEGILDTAFTAGLAGLIAGRLAAMIAGGTNPVTRPGDIVIIRGGVDPIVASFVAVATLAIVFRRRFWVASDALAAASLAGLAVWHAGCLVRDACLGTPSDLPWAMARAGSTVTRHPVELYAAVLLAAGALLVLAWRRWPAAPGSAGATAVSIAAAVRLVTEPMRPVLATGRAGWYLAGVLAGLLLLTSRALVARRSGVT